MMLSILQSDGFSGILIAAVFAAPLAVIVLILFRRKRRLDEETREPFTDLPLRPPGESLRLRVDAINARMDDTFLVGAAIGLGAVMLVLSSSVARFHALVLSTVVCAIGYPIVARRLMALQKELWRYKLGYLGERAVGELLNELQVDGFKVFHDLPFDGFNIDHVVVGPTGVFAVETKTRRKPKNSGLKDEGVVVHDRHTLYFPRWKDTVSVDQALLNADTLGKWLTKATGAWTPVEAILTIPGWWVESDSADIARVINPKQIRPALRSSNQRISSDQIQRIVHQLTERCRLAKDRKA